MLTKSRNAAQTYQHEHNTWQPRCVENTISLQALPSTHTQTHTISKPPPQQTLVIVCDGLPAATHCSSNHTSSPAQSSQQGDQARVGQRPASSQQQFRCLSDRVLNPVLTEGHREATQFMLMDHTCDLSTQATHTALGSNKALYQHCINKAPKHCIESLCVHVPVDHSLHSQEARLHTYKWCPNCHHYAVKDADCTDQARHGAPDNASTGLLDYPQQRSTSNAHHHTPGQKHYQHLQLTYGAHHSSCLLADKTRRHALNHTIHSERNATPWTPSCAGLA